MTQAPAIRNPNAIDMDTPIRTERNKTLARQLQELFGLADTPRLGREKKPVLIELLAPNGRPVQSTADLRSFWERTYPEVRKELRGRYPKHPWPEDPWNAVATHRTKRGEERARERKGRD